MFSGLLSVRPSCASCGLNLAEHDSGDGPAVGATFILGFLIVGLAFWFEFRFNPPLWLHIIIWPIVTIPLAILIMRPMKAAMVYQQYHHRRTEMGG